MLINKKLLEQLISLASDSAEYLNSGERWITVKPHGDDSKGVHVKVEDGETSKQAVERKFSKSDDKKEKSISDFISEGYKVTPFFKSNASKMKDRSFKLYKDKSSGWMHELREGEKEITRKEYLEGLKSLADKIGEYKLVTNKNKDNIKEPRYEVYHKNKLIAHAFDIHTAKKTLNEHQDEINEYEGYLETLKKFHEPYKPKD